VELVTEPDINSADEARSFCQMYQLILRYLGVSNADMERGEMRCEVNISLKKPDDEKLGNLVEIKNINSFRSVARTIDYEISRQSEILDKGEEVQRENRGWDDNSGKTVPQRSKEEAHEYRYFPEPDIPPINFESNNLIDIEEVKKSLPELPQDRLSKFSAEIGLNKNDSADLVFNQVWGDYFEKITSKDQTIDPKLVANWIINEGLSSLDQEYALDLLQLISKGEISGKIAKEILPEIRENKIMASKLVAEKGISHIKDDEMIEKIINEVLAENTQSVNDYKAGKVVALKFLVGAVMKKTQGQADPAMVNMILEKNLREG
jgi:aspartyl-tRNA(Asn)/glutamyl-tRNA(Gln) amidotransferase subunit B